MPEPTPPPLGFEKDAKEIEKINHLVAKTHPDLLLACFGCPKQENGSMKIIKNAAPLYPYVQGRL